MRFIKLIMLLCITQPIMCQTITLVTPLSNALQESSGLLYLNGKLITHTDAGGDNALFEIDTATGNFNRKVVIQNASNIDWEDICADHQFIYIVDLGNNQGSRTNLRIYKISIQDYINTDTLWADTISFNYSDQVNFTPSNFSTNYDAESLISYGDSLYIFTKNWGDLKTNIYPIPKLAGNYSVTKIDSLNPEGIITAADCDSAQKSITLLGHTLNQSYIIKIENWNGLFSSGQYTKQIFFPNASLQTEGLTYIDSFRYYVSSELFQSSASELHILDCRFPNTTPAQ